MTGHVQRAEGQGPSALPGAPPSKECSTCGQSSHDVCVWNSTEGVGQERFIDVHGQISQLHPRRHPLVIRSSTELADMTSTPDLGVQAICVVSMSWVHIQDAIAVDGRDCLQDWGLMVSVSPSPAVCVVYGACWEHPGWWSHQNVCSVRTLNFPML